MPHPIRFGVQTWPQHTSWAELRATWQLIDRLGYDTAWTFDHFFPIMSDASGPCLEGWIALAALAAETARVRLGVLVTGNTYRHPAVLANMGATLDHTSGGRLIMGVGAAWFEAEHAAYGIPFGTAAERIRRLDEAAEIIRRLWTEPRVTFDGRDYRLRDAYCEPKPVQRPHPPLMIGGGGEKLMLRVVAKHADCWNTFGTPEVFRRKLAVLREHCRAVGRDPAAIEVSWAGTELLDTPPARARARIAEFLGAGVTHFILGVGAPFDHDALRRFAGEVIPTFRR